MQIMSFGTAAVTLRPVYICMYGTNALFSGLLMCVCVSDFSQLNCSSLTRDHPDQLKRCEDELSKSTYPSLAPLPFS